MRRVAAFLCLLAAIFACSTACAATGNRLRLVYIRASNPVFPATQTVPFGDSTRVGFGGSPLGYLNPVNLGKSRWLAITNQIDHLGAAAKVWVLDERQMLVPTNTVSGNPAPITSANYSTPWTTTHTGFSLTCGGFSAVECYTVTVDEYFDAAHTLPTGNESIVTVPILAATAHAREATSAANGCLINCATIKPDGCTTPPGCVSYGSTVNQINLSISTGTSLTGGGTLVLRDAGTTAVSPTPFNPKNLEVRIRPLASYTGGGVITVTSENPDNSPDEFGNPFRNKNGFQYGGGIKFDTALVSDPSAVIPVNLSHLWCYVTDSTSVQNCLQWATATGGVNNAGAGVGVNLSYIRFEIAPSGKKVEGAKWHTGATVDHNYCRAIEKCLITTGNSTITDNIGEELQDDFIDIGYCNNDVERNWAFNWAGLYPNHGDFLQHNAPVLTGLNCNYGTIAYNLSTLTNYQLNKGDAPQGLFQRETASLNNFYNNALYTNNALNHAAQQALHFARQNNITIQYSMFLQHFNDGLPLTFTGSISGNVLTVSSISQGGVYVGTQVANLAGGGCWNGTSPPTPPAGAGVLCGQYITGQLTGTPHGAGTYSLGLSQTAIGSQTINNVASYSIVHSDPVPGDGTQGSGLTVTNVVTNYFDFASQNGTKTLTNAVCVNATPGVCGTNNASAAANLIAFPNMTQSSNPGWTTRAIYLLAIAPAYRVTVASGGVWNPDGSYSSAVTPLDSTGNHVCWNQGITNFDNTKTCAQQGLTVAQ